MRIAVAGCAGRMGRAVLREVAAERDLELVGGFERPGHPLIGQDLGALIGASPVGRVVEGDAGSVIRRAEVVIDFSTPEATAANAELCAAAGTALVAGTTGLDDRQRARLDDAAKRVPVVWAPNMSQGVNLLLALVARAAEVLGEEFDIEIAEFHHRHKVDAPSGTALALARAAAAARGVDVEQALVTARTGIVGARPAGQIGVAVLRGGDVVGDHSVVFAGPGERIELVHRASDRAIYARGALRAARWLQGRAPGLYSMAEVLGLGALSAR